MKKIIALILISILALVSVCAEPVLFLNPFEGATNIPLDSSAYWPIKPRQNSSNHGLDAGWQPNTHDEFLLDRKNHLGGYANFSMIATGGVRNIPLSDLQNSPNGDLTLEITLTSPVGLNFVSLSMPQIKRPYEVYVTLKISRGWFDSYGEPDKETTLRFTKSGEKLSVTIPKDQLENYGNAGDYISMWFDMVLCLPGEIPANGEERAPYSLADKNDFITINGAKYRMVVADDYSSVLYATMELKGPDIAGFNVPYEISIPLNGFYSEAKQPVKPAASAIAMSIVPSPNCHNLDLRRQQGQYVPIANVAINLPTVNLGGSTTPTAEAEQRVYMFLSSHPDPFSTPTGIDDRFMFRHQSVSPFAPYNTRTHMLYTIELRDKKTGKIYTYDGTMNVSETDTVDSLLSKGDSPSDLKNKIVPTSMSEVRRDMQGYKVFQSLDADIGLKMENKQAIGMKRGVYRSKVYVHVISDNVTGGK